MDSFSLIVLDDTLELASEAMTSVQRVTDDVKVIRGYMNLIVCDPGNASEYVVKLHQAIADLTEAANQNEQFFIAGRLENIARNLPRDRQAS
jgi:hypothetical protein